LHDIVAVEPFGERRTMHDKGQVGNPVRRWNQEAGETTGEQRISRDIAAGDEGKALKTRILRVDVA
jgi:hypothetical protein